MTKKNEAGCVVCGGSIFDIHPARGEKSCVGCGLVKPMLDQAGSASYRSESHNTPSTDLGSSPSTRGMPRGAKRAAKKARKRPSFIEQLDILVDQAIPKGRIRETVKDFLRRYNREDSLLWRKRKKLQGGSDALYRKRVLVAGALTALNATGVPSDVRRIAKDWGIANRDLVHAASMFRRFILKSDGPRDPRAMRERRGRELVFHLGCFRDLLAERVGAELASIIYQEAIGELAENHEPVMDELVDDGCAIEATKYGTRSSELAAWESNLYAMVSLGLNSSVIRWLVERKAVPASGGNMTRSYAREANKRSSQMVVVEEE